MRETNQNLLAGEVTAIRNPVTSKKKTHNVVLSPIKYEYLLV